jgi:hypothetical protein
MAETIALARLVVRVWRLDAEYRWALLHWKWLQGMLADKTLDLLAR